MQRGGVQRSLFGKKRGYPQTYPRNPALASNLGVTFERLSSMIQDPPAKQDDSDS